jgi:hypothetical protein
LHEDLNRSYLPPRKVGGAFNPFATGPMNVSFGGAHQDPGVVGGEDTAAKLNMNRTPTLESIVV